MVKSRIVVYSKEEMGEDFIDYLSESIKKKEKICLDEISNEFIEASFEEADYIIVHYYTNNDDVRGFCCVQKKSNYLYIDLICNVGYHSMKTRSSENKLGGKAMIEKVYELAASLGIRDVRLSSVEKVLPYYYKKQGFEFERPDRRNKYSKLVDKLNHSDPETQRKTLTKIVQGQYPGFYAESKQAELATMDDRLEPFLDTGIPMVNKTATRRYRQDQARGSRKKKYRGTKKNKRSKRKQSKNNKRKN